MKQRIRVISNGHGEDAIAVTLMQQIDQDQYQLVACPLVGRGAAYRQIGLTPIMEQDDMPSGGFLRHPMDVLKDLSSGLIGTTLTQRNILKKYPAALQLVVGDVFALIMATWKNDIPTMFFPTAKSERVIPHSKIELMIIKRLAKQVFPRDIETHDLMIERGISSIFFGNPMFDGLQSDLGQCESNIIGVLPGSRYEAVGNIAQVLETISKAQIQASKTFVLALSPHFTASVLQSAIQDTPWRLDKRGENLVFVYSRFPLEVPISYRFMDVLHQSSVVIGLAGTANEQAMFAKRPLISFIGTGPQSTKRRFMEQHQLIEGAQTFLIDSNDSTVIANEVSKILNDHSFNWQPLPDAQYVAGDIIKACLDSQPR